MTFEQIARKVKRPPSAQNWVRLNALGDLVKTTNLIVRFSLAIPPFNYVPAVGACKHKVCLGLDLDTAVKSVLRSGAPEGRSSNESLVRAFYEYDVARRYGSEGAVESFEDGAYRVSRDVRVPTRPSFTVRSSGLLVPITLLGWKDIPFDASELRLFMTLLEAGLYSYADYRKSPGEVIAFPATDASSGRNRQSLLLRRGDFDPFPAGMLRDQSALYVEAQAAALPIAEQLWHEREEKRRKGAPNTGKERRLPAEPDLFG